MKKIMLGGLLWLSLAACERDKSETPTPEEVNNFRELKVADNFNWNNIQTITIAVNGLSTQEAVREMLEVRSLNGEMLHRELVGMDESRELSFEAGAHIEEVVVTYGTIEKQLTLSASGKADFDFLPVDDRSDLDPQDR